MALGLGGGNRGISYLRSLINGVISSIKTSWSATTLNTNIPSEKLVKDSLDLKADITPANGSTSALRALFIARGLGACIYNATTNLYYLNGLAHTEDEILNCYLKTAYINWGTVTTGLLNGNLLGIKTIFPPTTDFTYNYSGSFNSLYIGNKSIIVCNYSVLDPIRGLRGTSYINLYRDCVNLVDGGIITVDLVAHSSLFVNMLNNCVKLETIKIYYLKIDFSFAWSPLLSLASLQSLVTKRFNGTTRITITVHPTVWSKLNDSVNYPEWNALLVDAVDNQYIDFASA